MTYKKSFIVRRTVTLFDVQEFKVDCAVDECDAREQAEALIAASSSSKPGRIEGVHQTICEIADAGESASWDIALAD